MDKSKEIIDKIKRDHIQPRPRWHFLLKDTLIWLACGIGIFIGAAAFSVILFAIQQTDFELTTHLSHSRFELVLGLLPFIWIIALIVFLLIAIFSLQKSRSGYKFSWLRLVGFSALLSILLGTLFFIGGGAQWLESTFAANVSVYEGIQEKKQKMWMSPEAGLLSGMVEEANPGQFVLVDFEQKKWTVAYDSSTFIAPVVVLEAGEQVKMVGKQTDNSHFTAEEIRPWGGRANRQKMQDRRGKN
ncbi:MAG: hypothetical protein R2792_17920 [Saprospiraceae bacterium]